MTISDIYKKLNYRFSGTFFYELQNSYVFEWESDYFCMSSSGYFYEIEIKCSRSDFFADFKKIKKHETLQNKTKFFKPHRFFYCCPKDLIKLHEIPRYAGLIYCDFSAEIVKPAPFLHKENIRKDVKNILTDKYYYKSKDLYRQLIDAEYDIKNYRGQVEQLKNIIKNYELEKQQLKLFS